MAVKGISIGMLLRRDVLSLLTILSVATALAIAVSSIQVSTIQPFMLQRTVDIWVEDRSIYVNVSVFVPGALYYYYYYYNYGYYYYTGYYYYYVGIPVKVMVVLEDISNNKTLIKRFHSLELVAGGTNYQGQVVFYNLEPGHYRVKVLFWNDFLIKLKERGEGWIPMAYPEFKEVVIS